MTTNDTTTAAEPAPYLTHFPPGTTYPLKFTGPGQTDVETFETGWLAPDMSGGPWAGEDLEIVPPSP